LTDAIFDLANPELQGSLDDAVARSLIAKLTA
jgi:hypothetical protein